MLPQTSTCGTLFATYEALAYGEAMLSSSTSCETSCGCQSMRIVRARRTLRRGHPRGGAGGRKMAEKHNLLHQAHSTAPLAARESGAHTLLTWSVMVAREPRIMIMVHIFPKIVVGYWYSGGVSHGS